MPSLAPYIPAKNADFLAWSQNFSTLITANPTTYGLATGDASTIASVYANLRAAYTLISSPATKTAATVQAFNAEKVVAHATFRAYAQQVANNAGVQSSDKVALGVNARTSTPQPITAPTTSPVISAVSTSTAGTIIRYRDATASPSVKAKPYGVTGVMIFAATSATTIADPELLPWVTTQTKSPFTLSMGSGAAGKTLYIAARWVTRRGLLGPWSSVISYVVAG